MLATYVHTYINGYVCMCILNIAEVFFFFFTHDWFRGVEGNMNEKILFMKKLSSMEKMALISFSGLLYWPVPPILQVLCGLADSNSQLPSAQKIAELLLSHLKRCPSPRSGHTGLGTYMGTGCSPCSTWK